MFNNLNMRSNDSDLTTEARIRLSALRLFGEFGSDAVSVRKIAAEAGVSAASVIHHFGSKDGLITAVDEYFAERVEARFDDFAESGSAAEAQSVIVSLAQEPDLFAYMARAFSSPGRAGDRLYDRMYEIALGFLTDMGDAGIARRVDDPEAMAAWLLAADLGVLVMRSHLVRRLGVDPYSTEGLERMTAVEFDVITNGLLTFNEPEVPQEPEE